MTSLSARIYANDVPGKTLVATTSQAPPAWLNALARNGVDKLMCGEGPRVDIDQLFQALGQRGLNDVLVEGGARVLGSMFTAGLVDRVAAFIAPLVIGGSTAPGPVGGVGVERVADAWRISNLRTRILGDDLLMEGIVSGPPLRKTEGDRMFTGIVEEIGTIGPASQIGTGTLHIRCQTVMERIGIGDSIAVNGVCLTVTSLRDDGFTADLQPVTRRMSNLGTLSAGNDVNLERSVGVGQR
ncbi:MAG: dihydrofolate reductase family protein, partial [Thermomicrobiales bacterium]